MKTIKMLTILALVTMVCLNEVSEASFRDEFNVSGLAYTGSNSYGSGGSYTVSGGKLRITTGVNNTYSVMTSNTVEFNIGDILSLDVPAVSGTESVFMMCSTSAAQPDGTSTFGFRFRRDGVMYARMSLYPGGTPANTLDPNPNLPAKLIIKRTSDTYFEYSIKIEGVQTNLGSFTLTNLSGNYNLFIGAQAYKQTSGTTFAFDNLQVYNPNFTDITVLTYNTHLFEDSSAECPCRCRDWWYHNCAWEGTYAFQDVTRREAIAAWVEASGADIVALQEVWAPSWQQWFVDRLKVPYPNAEIKKSQEMCSTDITNWCFVTGCGGSILTLGSGLVLLSKWPLSEVDFERFPVFEVCTLGDCEAWSDKGVLTATVNVGEAPIRIGISHALTGPDDYNSKWDTDYVANAITTFQLNGEAYIFALKKNGQGHIRHFEDYSYFNEATQTQKHGAGWKHIYAGTWGADYVSVVSFELDGHPYLFGLDKSGRARITRINDDPSTGWTYMYGGDWGSDYVAVTSFEMDGHPYIFGLDANEQAHITRINNNPATGWEQIYGGAWGSGYDVVTSFELDGHPYLFSVHDQNDDAHIFRINDDPCTGWKDIYEDGYPHELNLVSSFELQGHPYLFACNNKTNVNAHIFRINNDPCTGWEHIGEGNWHTDSMAVKSFDMNGHPYLFAQRNCCDQSLDSPLCRPRPGEAYLKRINDDPNTGWENLYQLEDMKIIRDATVVEDGPPAIMMGDFNIHRGKYGIMDQLFRKAGAVDAYIEVHGTGDGGETIDWYNNKLTPHFWPDPKGDPDAVDRIDYVYVKQSGAGLRLVPTEAHVIRNWKYGGDNMDLSDHYPVVTKFRIFQGGCTARMKGDLNCDRVIGLGDLAILCSAWLSQPGDAMWDSACDMSDPMDDRIDVKDFERLARYWGAMAVHNVTQDTWYGFIQVAINDANDGDEIEASPGTYYEAINFKGKAVRLYSSGGHDVTTVDGSGAYHVVQCVSGEDANTILDGFTITGGNANGVGESGYGGGMYNKASSPSVTNCIFRDNKAAYGGGMLNDGSSPIMTNCTFSGNLATFGGGMQNVASSPTLTYCTFSGNSATSNSGGMHNVGSSPTLNHCTFSGNTADVHAGAMINAYNSSPVMIDCTFTDNSASSNGGGMYNLASSPTLTNCTFADNSAGTDGGGMYNTGNSNAVLIGCTFNNMTYGNNGGGMHNASSNPKLTNCIFSRNIAEKYGGGMFNNAGRPTLTNCIFYENTAVTASGGGYANYYGSNSTLINCTVYQNLAGCGLRNWDSTLVVKNCILWRNYPCEISSDGASSLTVSYSNVQGGGYTGTGNINEWPFFVDPNGGDLRLSSGSPCIDKGSNAAVPSGITTDLDGNPRVFDGDDNGTDIVDMGAYEYLPGAPAAGSAANLEACCVLAANWLEAPWPRQPDEVFRPVPAMQDPDLEYFSERVAYRPATR